MRQSNNIFKPVWWYFLFGPVVAIYGYCMRQWFDLFWAFIFVNYGVIPLLDQILPEDWKNPTLKQIQELEFDVRYRLLLYFFLIVDTFIFVSEIGTANTLTLFNFLPRMFAMANVYATSIVLSH
jgi:hypothetical protein